MIQNYFQTVAKCLRTTVKLIFVMLPVRYLHFYFNFLGSLGLTVEFQSFYKMADDQSI